MEITQMTQAQFTQINGQPVMILREGTSRSRGRDAQRSNITAAKVIAETVKSSLGPKGMDKMLVDGLGDITITSDGATILKEMDVQHPAAKMMVEVSKTTDDEVGDGTTSVVVLSGKLLEKAETLINSNIHPIYRHRDHGITYRYRHAEKSGDDLDGQQTRRGLSRLLIGYRC
jgi:hypothetical protein